MYNSCISTKCHDLHLNDNFKPLQILSESHFLLNCELNNFSKSTNFTKNVSSYL